MKNVKVLKVFFVLLGCGLMNACGSCGAAPTGNWNSANSGKNTNVIRPQKAANANGAASNANANANLRLYPGLEKGKDPTTDNSKVKVIDTSKLKAKPPVRKMPDNSEMSTVGKPDGSFVESRKFLNHAQLVKIERTIKSAKDITLNVYLRNGKKITLPNDKLKNYRTASAAQILRAAGFKVDDPRSRPGAVKVDETEKKPAGGKAPVSNDN
jgi:hypothetical protein